MTVICGCIVSMPAVNSSGNEASSIHLKTPGGTGSSPMSFREAPTINRNQRLQKESCILEIQQGFSIAWTQKQEKSTGNLKWAEPFPLGRPLPMAGCSPDSREVNVSSIAWRPKPVKCCGNKPSQEAGYGALPLLMM